MNTQPLRMSDVMSAFPEFQLGERPLGEGGMKSAFHILGEDQRVLKIIREPLPDEALEGAVSLPERIRREIEGMRAISHPRIVEIVDGPDVRPVGENSYVWYSEPFFSGGTLADHLGTPWPESKCRDLISDLVDAADVLAQNKVVHRDIKPTNIVFDESDRPVLLDLGIAYFQDLTPLTEHWGQSPKTPTYAAPEQFDFRMNASIDFRTDLFQIGIVAFEAMTGSHPFNPTDPEGYIERLSKGNYDRSALCDTNVSVGMQRVLGRLLSASVSRRYRKFEHLREALEECQ
ncbi:MAG: serine/threonine protein kinase [Acidimicrobiaceae bacterium]|nr:serine/threonine protein kinase [Acidimicrobiaceae bacterium]MXZ65883.1 serine/threonine protein kinase [Acidimicrobiaceae bacterium]MYF32107.1 serine/threonine protein kinase [Acidimicrobiaceae bacterium]MYJ30968.1 serine/threonine protein kinase [Acidimicrobiaceae bacterium]MYJ85069.1 serine/threonine protein kinase [Acidimicrobiaceae bacterium]